MSSLNKFFRFMPLFFSISLLLFLSACSDTSSGSSPSIHAKSSIDSSFNSLIHANPLSYTFELPAQQKLRNISSDFSVPETGADTGIFLLPDEKVEILASGSASVQPGGKLSGPEGVPVCLKSDLPEPNLPCYSVVYSIGISGRAGEVGNQVGFNSPTEGNLFLGVNAANVDANAGSFSVSVLIIQKGKMAALWVAPEDRFALQGTSTTLSARVFTQDTIIDSLQFTIAVAGEADVQICVAHFSSGDTYSCTWEFKQNGKILQNGPVTFGFVLKGRSLSGSPLKPNVNPAGMRTGVIRYIQEQDGIYAGYAATNLNGPITYQKVTGSWIIPQISCESGEVSRMGVWVGMTNANPVENSVLAQLGTDSECLSGIPIYFMWWEMYPDPSVPLRQPVSPGETVTASVAFQNGKFQLSIDDPQEKYHFSTTQAGNIVDTSTTECIVEAPQAKDPNTGNYQASYLADFNIVNVSCQLNDTKAIADGPQDILYKMTDTGVLQAEASNLDAAGSGFTVQWEHR